MPPDPIALLTELYAAAVAAADPAVATTAALLRHPLRPLGPGRRWLIAVGKAAPAMATAAVRALARLGEPPPAGGVVVAAAPTPAPAADMEVVVGDHPVPGEGSLLAAGEVGAVVARVGTCDQVLVLLSGGASALMAAPVAGVDPADLTLLFRRLLGAGVDIHVTNQIRKRFLRWGGGRLAAALAPVPVRVLAASDVAGDDPADIGSGPCAADPLTAAALMDVVERHGLHGALPPALHAHLAAAARGAVPETPKPGDPVLAGVTHEIVLRTADALRGVARRAATRALAVHVAPTELAGEAREAGVAIADDLLRRRARGERWTCVVHGGETTVTVPAHGGGTGGRCQELALAAARRLHEAGDAARGVWLLAAGTDGRDGDTDAAGAVVGAHTWTAIADAGMDPAAALAAHDSHPALRAAGALLPARVTGTNVRDVVIGLVAP